MKTANDPRHQERQKLIQELFAWDAHQKSQNDSKAPLSPKTQKIVSRIPEIDRLVKECAPEWEIDRINQVDLAVLRLGIFELAIESDAPAKVIIDECVELAKEFGSENSPGFINGALGKTLMLPKRIRNVISTKLGVEESLVVDDADLRSDLNATDLEISDLLTSFEKDYDITFEKGLYPKKVGDLIAVIEDQQIS